MRILIAYPGHTWSTWDLAEGHRQALADAGHQVQTFDYHSRLSFYQVALTAWEETNEDFTNDAGAVSVLASEALILEAIDFVPDVVLVVSGLNLHRRAYDLLHRLHLPAVLLTTEAPYADNLHAVLIELGHIAGTLANDRASLANLPGHVAYLPQSYNRAIHYPRPGASDGPPVFFHGTMWPERLDLLTPLMARYPEIGGLFITQPDDPRSQTIPNEKLAERYSAATISLNHHRTIRADGTGPVADAWSIGPRPYEIAASGGFMVSDYRPELDHIFGAHVPIYSSRAELEDLITYYLNNEQDRLYLQAKQAAAVAGCSYHDRARDIVIPFLQEVI